MTWDSGVIIFALCEFFCSFILSVYDLLNKAYYLYISSLIENNVLYALDL